jgi:hypothetical protein
MDYWTELIECGIAKLLNLNIKILLVDRRATFLSWVEVQTKFVLTTVYLDSRLPSPFD